MKVLLVASDKAELKGFDDRYLRTVTGVGPVMAAAGTAYAICEYRPNIVISIGSAGALNSNLKIGHAYSFSSIVTPDQDLRYMHVALGSTLDENRATTGEIRTADTSSSLVLLSSGRFSDKIRDEHILLKADASDMEAYGAAVASSKAGIKFYAVKLITDYVSDSSSLGDILFSLREARECMIRLVDSLVF